MPTLPIPQLGNTLNTELPAQFLGLAQYAAGLNVDMDHAALKKRPGLAAFFSGVAGIPMLFQDFVDINNKRWLMVVTSTKVYSFDEVSLALVDRTPPGYAALFSTPAQATTFQFKWYLVNGSGFWSWDGATATLSALPAGSPQTAKALIAFGNHLILGNVVTSGGIVDVFKAAWSDFLNGTIWTTGDALSADIVDGNDAIMAFGFISRLAAMFKEDSVYTLTPIVSPLFYQFDRRVDYAGCIATATVANIPGLGLAHLWRDDLYIFSGIESRPISYYAQNRASLRRDMYSVLNSSFVNTSFAVRDMARQKYLLFIPTQAWSITAPAYAVYVFDWIYRTLTKYDYSDIAGQITSGGGGEHTFKVSRTFAQSPYAFSASPYRFNDLSASQASSTPLFGGATSGKVYRQPPVAQYTDDGVGYLSSAQTGFLDPSKELDEMRCVSADVVFKPGAATVNISLVTSPDGDTLNTFGPQAISLAAGARKKTAYFDRTDIFFALKLDDASGTVGWEARSAQLEFAEEAAKR